MQPLREAVARALHEWSFMPRWERADIEKRVRLNWIAKRLRCAPDDDLEALIASEIASRLP